MSKSRKNPEQIMAEKIQIQAEGIVRAFQRLIQIHKPDSPWRFTYSISLSAEPIAEVKQKVESEKKKAK